MSEVRPESVLELRKAILNHDTWNESMPELAGFAYDGFITIEGGEVERARLPAAVLARLGVVETDVDDGSRYQVDLGRHINRQFSTLTSMYNSWPEGQQWDPKYVYDDYGADAAYIRVGRSREGDSGIDILCLAQYIISAQEAYEPSRPPLCSVRIITEDRSPWRQLIVDLGERGGSLDDIARALNINPISGERDIDKPEVTSDTDLRANLARELGEPLSQEQIAAFREDEIIANEMQQIETEVCPLTTVEILGLAAVARSIQTSAPC